MNEGVPASRRDRRALGRRALRREARQGVERCYELYHERGLSPKAIASSLGWPVDFVKKVLGVEGEPNDRGGGGHA